VLWERRKIGYIPAAMGIVKPKGEFMSDNTVK